jgi:hypothetical protein
MVPLMLALLLLMLAAPESAATWIFSAAHRDTFGFDQ